MASTILVLKMHHNGKNNSRVPEWIKKILFLKLNFGEVYTQSNTNKNLKQQICFQNEDEMIFKAGYLTEKKAKKTLKLFKKILEIGQKFFECYKKEKFNLTNDEILDNEWHVVARRIDRIFFLITIVTVDVAPVYFFGKFLFSDNIENAFLNKCSC